MLENIKNPKYLKNLNSAQLIQLSEEIREYLVESVSKTGGHLGPNLGVVELTIIIHQKFNSPYDKIIFDTGHQSYVHKLLTGRKDFSKLRQENGISGYPDREESEHDIVENSHASSSLSWADGISRAYKLNGNHDRYVIVVIGDGALTGGMAWEALNNIATDENRKVIIVVNDNGRSYAPTVGGLAKYFSRLRKTIDHYRTTKTYKGLIDKFEDRFAEAEGAKKLLYKSLQSVRKGVKEIFIPQGMFEDLGLMYIGPVDGHNIQDLGEAFDCAKNYGGPVIVHAITEKGHKYEHAVAHEGDQFHAVGIIDPKTGLPPVTKFSNIKLKTTKSWTSVFEDEILAIASKNKDVIGVTAAMLIPVGFQKFKEKYPDRVIDVGIAEQHAVASAAGMAYVGLHPVVAIYATFLNRAFDQLLMDVALHNAGVTFILDRAGITGPDGPSHHGMWDIALTQIIPNIKVACPRDEERLREELRESISIKHSPTVIRFPKGYVCNNISSIKRLYDGVDILLEDTQKDILIISIGNMAIKSLEISKLLKDNNSIGVTIVDPRWILPIQSSLIHMGKQYKMVVTIEDGVYIGGIGSHIRQVFHNNNIKTTIHNIGLPTKFLKVGSRSEIFNRVGMDIKQITKDIVNIFQKIK